MKTINDKGEKMDVKNKLKNILEENKKLKEELQMAKTRLKENEANKDLQAPAPQPLTKSDGTALDAKNASADDLAKKYEENEADKDVQATPAQPVKPSDGDSAMKTDSVKASADDLAKKYSASKMEQSPEGEEDNKEEQVDLEEEGDKPETDLAEKYSEMEGDMGKVVEIMEALKNEVDNLKQEVAAMKGGNSEEGEGDVNVSEQPEPPITEKAHLRDVFVESLKVGNKDKFGQIVQKVIY